MKLWQWMQLNHTHSGYMDVAGKEELGGGAGVEEPGVKERIEEKDAAHTDELEGLSAEELIAKVREERKTSAGLLKESMKRKGNELSLKEKLAKYGDIAPERAIELVQAESAALKAREDAERLELERRGEFDAVKKQMVEAHGKDLEGRDSRISALEAEIAGMKSKLVEKTIGTSFGESPFLREKVLMTPAKARVIYGNHFEINEDGQVVGYDKPAGAKDRAVLVDGNGSPLAFEGAIERILRADPEVDALLRSEAKQGVGSKTTTKLKLSTDVKKSTLDKLTAGIGKLNK
ncbi:hypothetical protein DN614_25000 [Klebsiella michiganensis]|uniref:DUF6651 domain-containing protein n=1 Tax=Klebsiella michiganensis TaxID=1134687 RepID=UPI000FEBCE84|nr:DUF6651 domain-containing protein [Klebsiella michiganensis]RWS80848.1 hypothetical protein DN614_25000 [Klebsiella michiganensis]